ncbi:TMG4 protein, partial [Polyodon spathula]|nr:TMG4 protein [Polyodon spathula]
MRGVWIPQRACLLMTLLLLLLLACDALGAEADGYEKAAVSFLGRSLLYNSWDFEAIVPDNLERECLEEVCTYEEARECFEDDKATVRPVSSSQHPLVAQKACWEL